MTRTRVTPATSGRATEPEREAPRTAARVRAPDDHELQHVTARIRGAVGHDRDTAAGPRLADAVRLGLAAPAVPLPRDVRGVLEPQFGRDLSPIRLHRGPLATHSAGLLSARAYTVGAHIVLGGGPRPSLPLDTVTHEAAHAVQQGLGEPHDLEALERTSPSDVAERAAADAVHGRRRMPATGLAVAAESGGATPTRATVAQGTPIEDVLREFQREAMFGTERATVLARYLLQRMSDRRLWLEHGLAIVNHFLGENLDRDAQQALESVRDAWMLEHVLLEPPHGLPPMTLYGRGRGLDGLIGHAEAAARANRHNIAFRAFGTAYLLISWQLAAAGPAREQQLRSRGAAQEHVAGFTRSIFLYPSIQQAIDQLRRILGFYGRLSAEKREAGDSRAAAYYSGLSLLLYRDIRDNYVWESDQAMIAEVRHVQHPGGGGALRIFGANQANIDVTQLPGLPPPREVAGEGGFTFQRQSVGGLTDALFGQVELIAELQAEPAIQREFGATAIDMNDLRHRLRVWRTMYGVYARDDDLGMGVLYRLMSLIGRYLQAFTIHTQYNIDDFQRSYLANEMRDLPTDLAGRAERDCGVYALTVAYEVFRTARAVSPPLDLEFRLFAMPDHVTLVIRDRDQGEFYVVNNDTISPPQRGDVMEHVARAYVPIRGVANLVTPAAEVGLGTTAMGRAQFERHAWARYRDSTSWGIHVPEPEPGDEDRTPADRRERAYRAFYAAQRFYSESSPQLHAQVDALVGALASRTEASPLAVLRARIPALTRLAVDHGAAFEAAGPFARIDTARPDPALQRRLRGAKRFLYHSQRPNIDPPLARTAMALLHYEHLGGSLTEAQRAIIALADRASGMHEALERYRRAGFPASF